MAAKLKEMAAKFPLVFLTGPRQSGKSTLLKNALFKDFEYISLEDNQACDFAINDPRGFLNAFKGRVIIDEAHKAPVLISHIKEKIDEKGLSAMFILSGRLDPGTAKNISQSLGGRAVKFVLLPFSLSELSGAGRAPKTAKEWMFKGSYPELHSKAVEPSVFFRDYVSTILECDIKSELKVYALDKFKRFLAILAENSGSPVNLSKLGEGASVDSRTANSWISILEKQYILFRLAPYQGCLAKRYTKTPKLYFYDSGFLCFLLGLSCSQELNFHPMRSRIFETAVISEAAKKFFNAGFKPGLFYWRDLDNCEKEIDLIQVRPQRLDLAEIKFSQTPNEEFAKNLLDFPVLNEASIPGVSVSKKLVYAGNESAVFHGLHYTSWKLLGE
jgi:hypothetical protein